MKRIFILLFDPSYDVPSGAGVFATVKQAEAQAKIEMSKPEFNLREEDYHIIDINIPNNLLL